MHSNCVTVTFVLFFQVVFLKTATKILEKIWDGTKKLSFLHWPTPRSLNGNLLHNTSKQIRSRQIIFYYVFLFCSHEFYRHKKIFAHSYAINSDELAFHLLLVRCGERRIFFKVYQLCNAGYIEILFFAAIRYSSWSPDTW